MATIKSSLVLNDRMTSVLKTITRAMDLCVNSFETMQTAGQTAFDPSKAREMHIAIGQANAEIEEMERSYRTASQGQSNLNNKISRGQRLADGLGGKIKGLASAYLGMKSLTELVGLSDRLTSTKARLSLIVDDGSVADLQKKIFASAQASRGSYLATADAVSKLGMQASDAFTSNDELIAFTELLNKQFVNAGTSAQGIDSVMLQLTQAMAAGRLQGEELNAVLDNAQPIVANIQRYLKEVQGIDASNIKELASEGVLTAEIIKNAMFYTADETNEKFESMPMTWAQVWSGMKNRAIAALDPVLQKINEIANDPKVHNVLNGLTNALADIAIIVLDIFNLVVMVGNFIYDNWSIIAPIIKGVAGAYSALRTAIALYNAVQIISNSLEAISWARITLKTGATLAEAAATTTATGAQVGLNAALLACPTTWIVIGIIALIAALAALCSWIAKTTGKAQTGFGIFTGCIFVVGATLQNLFLLVLNIFHGIEHAFDALCGNLPAWFHNAITDIQSWFYSLLSTALIVVSGICSALNKLPFVEFDYSGITEKALTYAQKSAQAAADKIGYENVSSAFSTGFSTYDVFSDGWASSAFSSGAAWGDGIAAKIKDKFSFGDYDDVSKTLDLTGYADGIANNSGKTADNTGSVAKSLDTTNEELKWLRDIAEREAINRFTTAEVKIDMTGMTNAITSDVDIDGAFSRFTDEVAQALKTTAQGVY